jgi:hypothetical protein
VSTQVTMEDGTQQELTDHLHGDHQKGIRGFTEEYLRNLHATLHQRNRSPEPEHTHLDVESDEES